MTKRITTEDDLTNDLDGLSVESVIEYFAKVKSLLSACDGTGKIELEHGWESSSSLMLRCERNETPQETASRLVREKANEQRLQEAAKVAEAREYELFKKLSEKYGVTP